MGLAGGEGALEGERPRCARGVWRPLPLRAALPCGPGVSGRVSSSGYSVTAGTAAGPELGAALTKGSLGAVSVTDGFLASNPQIIQVFKSNFMF